MSVFGAAAAGALAALVGGVGLLTPTQVVERRPDWELVRSVSKPYGGTVDLVLIPEPTKRDTAHYTEIARIVCGRRTTCMVMFWANREHVPKTIDMPVPDLQVMTATYERDPADPVPVLKLACWLYSSKNAAEKAKCFYMLGVPVPWEK